MLKLTARRKAQAPRPPCASASTWNSTLPPGPSSLGAARRSISASTPREVWLALVQHWQQQPGVTVHVVQEACGFGWGFHHELLAAGAQSMVAAPEAMSGKQRTDKRDARALAVVLYDLAVRGNRRALRSVRVPSAAAHRRRSEGRHRSQLICLRNQIAAFGRTPMWDHDFREVPEGWHGPRKWVKLRTALKEAEQAMAARDGGAHAAATRRAHAFRGLGCLHRISGRGFRSGGGGARASCRGERLVRLVAGETCRCGGSQRGDARVEWLDERPDWKVARVTWPDERPDWEVARVDCHGQRSACRFTRADRHDECGFPYVARVTLRYERLYCEVTRA